MARTSHERSLLDKLESELVGIPGATFSRGMGSANRFQVAEWHLSGRQLFQFGDLRLHTATTEIVIEAESAGGVTNLAKYWPFLAGRPRLDRFVLVHLFQLFSENDYLAHRRLWEYLVERMRDDLERRCGVCWASHWEARLFTYHPGDTDLSEVVGYIRSLT